jgi:hypothetical protein
MTLFLTGAAGRSLQRVGASGPHPKVVTLFVKPQSHATSRVARDVRHAEGDA